MRGTEIREKVKQKEDFTTQGNLKGTNKNGIYICYSYNVPIMVQIGSVQYINKQQYSLTTSKHLNQVLSSTVLTTESALRRLINKKLEEVKCVK